MHHLFSIGAAVTAALLSTTGSAARAPQATPQIISLSEPALPRSGRVVVLGTGFGAAAGQLLIDGSSAIVTGWADAEIHGYVPEAAALGTVPVQVVTGSGASNTVSLAVTARTRVGHTRWRFRTDAGFIGGYLATGSDGSVYTSDNQRMYALTADGALQWVQPLGAGGQQITVGNDRTIYTGSRGRVVAMDPDGAVKWVYDSPFPNASIEAGPAVGPDGNVYAFQDAARGGGLGVFSLDANGNLRWSALPSPLPTPDINNAPIVFSEPGDARFYFAITSLRGGPYPATWAFDFGGSQLWYRNATCSTGPLLDPQSRIVLGGLGNCGITVIDKNNQTVWNAPPPQNFTFPVGPAVGPDGSSYVADWTGAELWSVDSNGKTRWFLPSSNNRGIMKNLAVTPDNELLLDGGRQTFGVPGWIRAYSTADGSFQWQENLPREAGFDQETESRPVFSADGRTAYYNTAFFGSTPGYAYVYAFAVSDEASWSNYGVGLAGTLGVPALTASGKPVLGSQIQVLLGNSRGIDTTGVLPLGVAPAGQPTGFGGTLLVTPTLAVPVQVPVAGLGIPLSIPANPAFSGISLYLQGLQLDPGAVRGVSFSPGLELALGLQ